MYFHSERKLVDLPKLKRDRLMVEIQQQVNSFNEQAKRKLLLTEVKLPDFQDINEKSYERQMDDSRSMGGDIAGIAGMGAGAAMAFSGKDKEKKELMDLEREKRDSEFSHFMFTQNRDRELGKMETYVHFIF